MKVIRPRRLASMALAAACLALPARAADQTLPGAGNAAAIAIAAKSPLVQSAWHQILAQLKEVTDKHLRALTQDAIANPETCVLHRAGLDPARKLAMLDRLKAEGLVDEADEVRVPGGLMAGVFPPVMADGSACPQAPQPFWAAPGSAFGSHHSEPGGLAIHTAFNLASDRSLAQNYRRIYGHRGKDGLPDVTPLGAAAPGPATATIFIDEDIVRLAPMWHDWTKMIVFQWTEDGREFTELEFGGNGKTDKYGATGDSKTGAHHILSLAETMKRGFPPAFIVTQASAHAAPTNGHEYQVVNWLRAAAILADVDPVANGYLTLDQAGHPRLPAFRQLGTVDLMNSLPGQPNLLVEYVLHNLSDADYSFTGPAVADAQVLLAKLAPVYGYDPADQARFNTKFRNPSLSYLSAEHVEITYASHGLAGVQAELDRLRKLGVI